MKKKLLFHQTEYARDVAFKSDLYIIVNADNNTPLVFIAGQFMQSMPFHPTVNENLPVELYDLETATDLMGRHKMWEASIDVDNCLPLNFKLIPVYTPEISFLKTYPNE